MLSVDTHPFGCLQNALENNDNPTYCQVTRQRSLYRQRELERSNRVWESLRWLGKRTPFETAPTKSYERVGRQHF